jgi:hypothetical protein
MTSRFTEKPTRVFPSQFVCELLEFDACRDPSISAGEFIESKMGLLADPVGRTRWYGILISSPPSAGGTMRTQRCSSSACLVD